MARTINTRQGLTAGIIVAFVTSGVVGVSAESFWVPFLTTLAFCAVCVGAAAWLLAHAQRENS